MSTGWLLGICGAQRGDLVLPTTNDKVAGWYSAWHRSEDQRNLPLWELKLPQFILAPDLEEGKCRVSPTLWPCAYLWCWNAVRSACLCRGMCHQNMYCIIYILYKVVIHSWIISWGIMRCKCLFILLAICEKVLFTFYLHVWTLIDSGGYN